ncbi:phage/plasmid primase, P4 family [Acinetobacter baumannii]|uniref:phage/plasmid primase, P4 family n=1 Tax=Acinetobacter baumannii TaxID=470 RepID=UPI0015E797DD|nr:phage/plasmid primase, P4 family [Acinetobacter baumannii]MCE6239766.1 PriCT-2 domain-containing protein [Acinetobacter baumannii]MCE6254109.1 PriCT-2 domain-containing protein [Acinetobacter baumannii]HAV3281118.1 DNA primase [Acinetobacter baumannii]HAV3294161.1 DNA primase [Acinetobacter baumannii]HCW4482238.1 PriCT-2 domain-containing protein [Acinetobacter baumannii]
MSYFKEHGKTLLAHHYMIVPIKQGLKRPVMDGWQNVRLTASDIPRFANQGVGILTGQGPFPICAVDIDVTDADLSHQFAEWCRDNLGVSCERVGNAPKILLVYRAEDSDWGKSTSAWFADPAEVDKPFKEIHKHRIEVLGRGQQFVAYHVHPDTGKPYEWVDFFGGLTEFAANALPTITKEQVEEAIKAFERMAEEHGFVRVKNSKSRIGALTSSELADEEDLLMTTTATIGWSLDDAKKYLEHIDNEDYDTWLRVGMSLHHEFDGSDVALELWNEWSSTASNYVSFEELEYRWGTFSGTGSTIITAHWLLKTGRESKQAKLRLEKRQVLADIKNQINDCRDQQELLQVVAKEAGKVAGTDLALRTELSGLLRQRFKQLTKISISAREVNIAMGGRKVQIALDDAQKRPMTEFGNASRMLDAYGNEIMFIAETNTWYRWNGVYWESCVNMVIEQYAKQTVLAMGDEAKKIDDDSQRAEFYQFCAMSQKAFMVKNMVTLAQSDPRVLVPIKELDSDIYLLGCANGAVNLRDGELVKPNQELLITYSTGVDYNPKAKCPLFEKTVLDAFFGDEEMSNFFRRLMGYAILGNPVENLMIIPFGDGANGKSTVFTTISKALGDYSTTTPAETFLGDAKSSAGGAREDILRLLGSRFVYVGEPEENKELKENLVKTITGGEKLSARGLYSRHTVEFTPTWTVVMPTNHKPIIKGSDHGIWRRLMMVPFERNYDKDKTLVKDPFLASKLANELPGVLAWLVRGAIEYQQEGLNPPEKTKRARDEYRDEMDLLKDWISECCEVGDPETVSELSSKLWESWQEYASKKGELRYIPTSRSLGRRLSSKFKTAKGANGARKMLGIRVRISADSDLFEDESSKQ